MLVAGSITKDAGNEDGWLRKYTPDSDERWTAVIDAEQHGDDRVWALALDESDLRTSPASRR